MAGEPWSGWGGSLKQLELVFWKRAWPCFGEERWEDVLDRNAVPGFRGDLGSSTGPPLTVPLAPSWSWGNGVRLHRSGITGVKHHVSCWQSTCSSKSPTRNQPRCGHILNPFWGQSFSSHSLHPHFLKTFFFKGVTLPSSGSERNFFLRVLLFLLKKKMPVLIQPNYF